jgi:hypothetical protein
MPTTQRWQPFAIPSAVGCQLIEQNERLQNCINFDDSPTIELAQRRSVLDRTDIGNPRCQESSLFRRRQLRVGRDFTGMS